MKLDRPLSPFEQEPHLFHFLLIVCAEGLGPEGPRHFLLAEALALEKGARLVLYLQGGGPTQHHGPILPVGSDVVLAHAHAAEGCGAPIRVFFRDVVKRNLPMVPDRVVRPADERKVRVGPIGNVGRVRDVDLDLYAVRQPVLTVPHRIVLQPAGARHRLTQVRLEQGKRVRHPLESLQLRKVTQRTLENVHPATSFLQFVVVLVDEDEVGRHSTHLVVRTHFAGQGLQVVHGHFERHAVRLALQVDSLVVVDPQDVIVFGPLDPLVQLPLELEPLRVGHPVAVCELVFRGLLDNRVELRLRVMIFREEPVLERKPHEAVVSPPVLRLGTGRLHGVDHRLEHVPHRLNSIGLNDGTLLGPLGQHLHGQVSQIIRRVLLLSNPQQTVVRKQHFLQQHGPGHLGHRVAAGRGHSERQVFTRERDRERARDFGVVGQELGARVMRAAEHGIGGRETDPDLPHVVRESRHRLVAAPARLIEVRHRQPIHPVRGLPNVGQHRFECGLSMVDRFEIGSIGRHRVRHAVRARLTRPLLSDRKVEPHVERTASREPIDRDLAAARDHAAPPERDRQAHQKRKAPVLEAPVDPKPQPDERNGEQGPKSAVRLAAPHTAVSLELQRRDRQNGAQQVLADSRAQVRSEVRGLVLVIATSRQATVGFERRRLTERRDLAALIRRDILCSGRERREQENQQKEG